MGTKKQGNREQNNKEKLNKNQENKNQENKNQENKNQENKNQENKNQENKNQENKNQGSGKLELAVMSLSWMLILFSAICVILVFGVLPLYCREGYTHMGTDKAYFLRTAAVAMSKWVLPVFGLWVVCKLLSVISGIQWGAHAIARPQGFRLWQHISTVDVFACFFAISAVLSWYFSHYRSTALWGTKGWYMGMLTQLTFVSIYFLLSWFENQKIAPWLLGLCLLISSAVFLLGLLNRFGIWPIPMENSGRPLFISTIGNINWYCSYAVVVLFVGAGLFWTDRGGRKGRAALLSGYVFLGFATLITQGSESGIFALVLVFAVLFVLSAFSQDTWKLLRFWQLVMLLGGAGTMIWMLRIIFDSRMNYSSRLGSLFYGPLALVLLLFALAGLWFFRNNVQKQGWKLIQHMAKLLLLLSSMAFVVFIVLIILNTWHPGILGKLSNQAVFTFNNKWGSSRGATWTIGLRCFWEQDFLHKFVGVGPDCMADFLYADSSSELLDAVRKTFVNKRLTNAHCELLTVLVNMGILGAVSYAGMWFCLLRRLLFSGKQSGKGELQQSPFAAACGLGMLAYFLNNLWSFQQSVGAATVFAIMGLGAYFARVN